MGRRPNQLVLEFFERGKKLQDSSNRYEHTCKRCGERFPKGRIDSLLSHLLRRCPHVTQQDRESVFHHMQQTPDKAKSNTDVLRTTTTPLVSSQEVSMSHEASLQAQIPWNLFQQQSALETLAEVSRRHLDFRQNTHGLDFNVQHSSQVLEQQAFLAQLHHAQSQPSLSTTDADISAFYASSLGVVSTGQEFDAAALVSSALDATPVSRAAVPLLQHSDDHQLHAGSPQHPQRAAVDPKLSMLGAQGESPPQPQSSQILLEDGSIPWDSQNYCETQTYGNSNTLSTEPTATFRPLQKPSRGKPRSRFTDARRKEVQGLRKRGACIRCRMLKKPCSDGDPCTTCRNIESARLWKGKCLRTRLAEEFRLWSVGLYRTRAKVEVPAAVLGLQQHALPGRIEARLMQGSDWFMTFACKEYSDPALDPSLQPGTNDGDPKNIVLLDEGESMSDKLEAYMNCIASVCIERERSRFLRATLQTAQTLLQTERVKNGAVDEHATIRSCYNLQEQLLKDIIEVWIETCILSSPQAFPIHLQHDDTRQPSGMPESSVLADPNPLSRSEISPSTQSQALMVSQLLAVIETRAARLGKQIINELERRLLQRQQVSAFSTFISVVILLSCVERMTGFFRTLDTDTEESSWPLDEAPSRLWAQGERFADLLTMLLRMRALPPKTTQGPDGTLSALQDYAMPVHVHGRPVKEQSHEQMAAVALWLDPIKLDISELLARRDGPAPGRDDGVEAWDMKFTSKVLLSEGGK